MNLIVGFILHFIDISVNSIFSFVIINFKLILHGHTTRVEYYTSMQIRK